MRQLDLFAGAQRPEASGEQISRPESRRRGQGTASRVRQPSPVLRVESAARLLDGHGDYRVLRRLKPRPVTAPRPLRPGERETVIIDTETTGLDHRHAEIIELGMVRFIHNGEGNLIEVTGVFSALQEPSQPIVERITKRGQLGFAVVVTAGQTHDR